MIFSAQPFPFKRAALLLTLLFTSCEPGENLPVGSPAQPVWNLNDFEQSDYLLMAITKTEVKISETQTLLSSQDNNLEILVNETNSTMEKGEIWGRYHTAQIQDRINKTQQLIAQTQSEINKRLEIDIPQQLLELDESIRKAEEAQRIQSQIDKNPNLAKNPAIANLLGGKSPSTISPEKLALLKKQKEHLEKTKNSPPPELQNTLDQLKEKHEQLENQLASPDLTMPFRGTLHLLIPDFKGKGSYPVKPQQPLAQCEKEESLLFYLDASTPYLTDTDPQQLTLRHTQVGKEPTMAPFSDTKVIWNGNQRQRYLTFQPPTPQAYLNHTDKYLRVQILQKLPQTCYLIPKLTLLNFHKQSTSPNWKALLEKQQPDYHMVAEGPSSLAIAPIGN